MPNHVTTILRVSGDDAQKQVMFEAIKNDEFGLGSLDFNKVIPMPENIFRGNLGQEGRAKYGSDNWYNWSIANWGTKWNCYPCGIKRFHTKEEANENLQGRYLLCRSYPCCRLRTGRHQAGADYPEQHRKLSMP